MNTVANEFNKKAEPFFCQTKELIAERIGLTPRSLTYYLNQDPDSPKPIKLGVYELYVTKEIKKWLLNKRKEQLK